MKQSDREKLGIVFEDDGEFWLEFFFPHDRALNLDLLNVYCYYLYRGILILLIFILIILVRAGYQFCLHTIRQMF